MNPEDEQYEEAEKEEPVDAVDTDEEEGDEEQPGDDTPEAPPPRGVQKRIDELTRKNHEARNENERLARLLAERHSQVQEQRNEEPQVDQFDDYAEYTKAVGVWAARNESTRADRERSARAQQDAADRKMGDLKSAGREKYADFDEVALSDKLPITDAMVDAISESEVGSDLAYYLGKNPLEAARIARLSPVKQVLEIGRLEAKAGSTPGKKPTGAPDPVQRVGRGGSATAPDPNKMSMKQWAAYRDKTARD